MGVGGLAWQVTRGSRWASLLLKTWPRCFQGVLCGWSGAETAPDSVCGRDVGAGVPSPVRPFWPRGVTCALPRVASETDARSGVPSEGSGENPSRSFVSCQGPGGFEGPRKPSLVSTQDSSREGPRLPRSRDRSAVPAAGAWVPCPPGVVLLQWRPGTLSTPVPRTLEAHVPAGEREDPTSSFHVRRVKIWEEDHFIFALSANESRNVHPFSSVTS